jgi:hypothetical protein
VAAVLGLVLLATIPIVGRSDRGGGTGARTNSPRTGSTATTPPPTSAPEPLSSQEAAAQVFDIVSEGIATGEVTGGITGEVQHKIDEAFGELEEHQDLEKALGKIAELQAKVTDALEKGEITSQARANAINDALDNLAAAFESEAG